MGDPSEAKVTNHSPHSQPAATNGIFVIWLAFAILAVVMAAGAVVVRLTSGPRFDGLLILAACASAVLLALRIPRIKATAKSAAPVPPGDPQTSILHSAGPAIVAVGLDGRVISANPAAERLLGADEAELKKMAGLIELLAPGEGTRLLSEMQRLAGINREAPDATPDSPGNRMSAYLEIVRTLPPSQLPCFDAQLRRKDGGIVPVTLHISALRNEAGSIAGLVAVAVDQNVTFRQEQDLRESQERYRDLFENSSEMMATLSPTGRFVYANPAWKRCFGLDQSALLALESFEELFEPDSRPEITTLFRRALDGTVIDRAPLRHHTADGRIFLFELSLSQRRKAGKPLAVRCMLRDVTHQKQRENRLALQLTVGQIISENAAPEIASMRILEALCISQGWDLAIKWRVNSKEDRLEFSTAWGMPGSDAEGLIRESAGRALNRGMELPGKVWQQGLPVWITEIAANALSPRVNLAVRQKMVSGWAVPVRVGNSVLAVLEFYSSRKLREDRDSMAAVETAAASLGQMLARSQEQGRAEELYRQQQILLDSVADGICGVDSQGLVTFANPAAARLLDASPASLSGKTVHELFHGSAPSPSKCGEDCPLRRMTNRHNASAGEDNVFRSNGSSFPAEYVLTPIHDQGHFSGSVLSFRDISQRNALDRLKDEFISTVSHELRTPLTSIRGALGLLSSGILGEINEKASNLLRIALTNSDRLVRLINDILDLERIQSGREPLSFRPVQLSDIVKQAIGDMQPVADSAGVRLLHDSTQVEIDADPYRLLQVLTNLLSNAVKFSPPNSTISIMLRPGATGVTLSVIDNGRGIPADKLEAIFGRFQQVDASDSRQKGGSGLGLAICRTIVLQHSGRIWAERNPVRGSTFRVFLPYHPVPLEMPAGPPDEEPGRGTILVACDNADVRLQMSSMLARHGYHIVESATAEQTVTAAHKGVEAILLDTSLDGMNGWEILPLLRRLEPEAHTPVVLLSLDAVRAQGQSSPRLPAGLNNWTKKTVEEDALLGAITGAICAPGEKARVLVVEEDGEFAAVISEVFARDETLVRMAHTLEDAIDSCFTFRPHLLVLNIGLPDGDGFNLVDWLRQHESLVRLPLAIYTRNSLSEAELAHVALGPTHFLSRARTQPQQLEALVLTMLRNPSQVEEVIQQA
jgi:PAS domain S-box-containing protein